ncbi:Fpg/Nei family DNA glycosylase [Streptomyces sp. HNM0574]|uniref:Fpg/Nei family DNA glycosylase n=1 Tax=Streptomyces sp. HNM0574 TaxID=2714954 RepID=UPI00146F0CCD|nr:Fpg/Nei family DNA glycosylase [Streptomyces sp. HNM0574]NLU65676.1 Fpg/Nei family DNA glycosylase [Streptomyces sp. HNM0574]
MPEGDTVWRTARQLHEALAGSRLVRSDFRTPKLATVDLSGRQVEEVVPRGKHLLARFEDGLTLHSHLGMEGVWHVAPTGTPPRGGPAHQIRARLTGERYTATGYRIPLLELLRTSEESTAVGHLGPDLLGPDWDPAEAERRLVADPGRLLAEALLDQRSVAGIGNVYVSELCFLARVSPWTPMVELPDALPGKLLAAAKNLLEANKDRPSRRTTHAPDSRHRDRALWVYGREHHPCHRCGTPVLTGGYGPPDRPRTIYYCPRCQSGPQPPAD